MDLVSVSLGTKGRSNGWPIRPVANDPPDKRLRRTNQNTY